MTDKKFRLGWITDPHLDYVTIEGLRSLFAKINNQDLDALVITGDIAEGNSIDNTMRFVTQQVKAPVFFVLGNHDYFVSTIAGVRANMVMNWSNFKEHGNQLVKHTGTWLPATTPSNGEQTFVQLTSDVALCGHDGWYDGLYADWFKSRIIMPDYNHITDLKLLQRQDLFDKLQELAKESADYAEKILPLAFDAGNSHVFFATHVPAFPENSVYNGMISDDQWMPHFSNKHLGDALKKIMESYPEKKLTILQGHSHGKTQFHPKPNIVSHTGFAKYRSPALNNVFDI